jgi:hypothetical protein
LLGEAAAAAALSIGTKFMHYSGERRQLSNDYQSPAGAMQ